jgi:O-antigen/teichoic acid export membrane protein
MDLLTEPRLARRISSSLIWRLFGRLITVAAGGISIVLLTRHLTINQYGYYIAATTIATFAGVLVDGGISGVAIREAAKDPGRRESLAASSAGARLISAFATIVLVALFVQFTYGGSERSGIRIGALVVSASLVFTAITGGAQVLGESSVRIGRLVVAEVAGRLVALAALWLVVVTDAGYDWVYLSLAAGTLASSTLLWSAYRGSALVRFDKSILSLYSSALPLGLALLLNALFFRIDAIILSTLRPSADVAQYGLAYRALEIVLSLGTFLLATMLPVMSAATRDRRRWEAIADRVFGLLFVAGLTVAVAGWFIAGPAMSLLGGRAYRGAGRALRVLLLAGALSWTNGFGGLLLISLDRQRRALWLNVVALAVNVAANVALIPTYGYMAAAWVTVASELVNFAGNLYLLRRHAGYVWLPTRWIKSAGWPPAGWPGALN